MLSRNDIGYAVSPCANTRSACAANPIFGVFGVCWHVGSLAPLLCAALLQQHSRSHEKQAPFQSNMEIGKGWNGQGVVWRGSLCRSDGRITVGVCAREKKARSKHMEAITSRLNSEKFEVRVCFAGCACERLPCNGVSRIKVVPAEAEGARQGVIGCG